jgi:hypothetical protein
VCALEEALHALRAQRVHVGSTCGPVFLDLGPRWARPHRYSAALGRLHCAMCCGSGAWFRPVSQFRVKKNFLFSFDLNFKTHIAPLKAPKI